jgi:hypothetical protein
MITDSARFSSAADAALLAPLDRDPEAIEKACIDGIRRWPIEAIGIRTEDWLAHDLLLYRLNRDRRAWMYHAARKNPADWAHSRLEHLPGAGAGIASPNDRGIQISALHYLHLRQLYLTRDWVLEEQSRCHPPYLLRRWQRLWDCPPVGLFTRSDHKLTPAAWFSFARGVGLGSACACGSAYSLINNVTSLNLFSFYGGTSPVIGSHPP